MFIKIRNIFILILSLMLIISLTGCSKSEEVAEEVTKEELDIREYNDVVFEDDEFKLTLKTIEFEPYNEDYGKHVIDMEFDAENKFDKDVVIHSQTLSVDGRMIPRPDVVMITNIQANKTAISNVTITAENEADLPKMENEMEFDIEVVDPEDYTVIKDIKITTEL